MSRIIGIRYVGKKPSSEDHVTDSGAVWLPGQVHNFAETLARKLLIHTDSFEEAPVSADGGIFMSGKVDGKAHVEAAAYVNLNAMSREQLTFYARREFNRILDANKTDEQARAEIQSLMVIANLDEIDRSPEVAASSDRVKAMVSVTPEELEALNAGILTVRFVPVLEDAVKVGTVQLTQAQAQALMDECAIEAVLDSPEDYALLAKNAPVLRDAFEAVRRIAANEAPEDEAPEDEAPEATKPSKKPRNKQVAA